MEKATEAAPVVPVVRLSAEADHARSPFKMAVRRFLRHRMAVLGSLLLGSIIIFVVGGAFFYSEADANFNDTSRRLQAPSNAHPFGTDQVGRDLFARTMYGGQISLIIGFFAMSVGVTIGTLFGTLSGYFGGFLDALIMRLTEAMLSIPALLVLLVASKFLAGRVRNLELPGRSLDGSIIIVIIIVGLTSWMVLGRIVRANILSLKEQEYVHAARSIGATHFRIIRVHLLPNTLAPIIVAATLGVGAAIITEAYISYLGLGVRPPAASWGNMLEGARRYVGQAPWMWVAPSVLIILTVLSINFIGDGLRDALDPQSDKGG